MSSNRINAVKGMNDILPEDVIYWHYVESAVREIVAQYGYQEIRTPLLEKTQLFKQSIGEQTDIVEKEMYTFVDAGKESITLRPEATASTVRACLQHGLLYNQQQRLWYMGPMFRRERPQRGRYRQFHQMGVEALGYAGADVDAEIILLAAKLFQRLGFKHLKLHINTLGGEQTRFKYRQALVDYFSQNIGSLDEDSCRRLESNPLRILDSKIPETQALVTHAPKMREFLEPEERARFDQLCGFLQQQGIDYIVDDRLVRGLDYYTSTVFEWVTDQLGAQSAVCGGGRYDQLISVRGGGDVPGVGFAIGLERLIELMRENKIAPEAQDPDVFLLHMDDGLQASSLQLAETLRAQGLRLVRNSETGKLKKLLKKADLSGAQIAVILGQQEAERDAVQIKWLRKDSADEDVSQSELGQWFLNNYSRK